MKKHHRISALLLGGLILLNGAALAETVSFEGSVVNGDEVQVYAPIGGTVDSVAVKAGQNVKAGEELAVLRTVKVYAEEDGTVTGVFGQPGDSAETIANKYGAVMYIEGECVYTISASTDKAYDATENKFVHVGEEVYLSCYTDGSHTGTGVITSIQGTDYTVQVLSGEFDIGETVSVYRGGEAKAAGRIGRGTLSRKTPSAVTASGSIVSFAVKDGDTVKRGDLLMETLDGSFDGGFMSGSTITAPVSGTISKIDLNAGGRLDKNGTVAVIWPEGSMRVSALIPETDLAYVAEGDSVEIELLWNQDTEVVYPGTIAEISHVAETVQGEEGTFYRAEIDFRADADTRYGMNAIITTVDAADAAGDEDVE